MAPGVAADQQVNTEVVGFKALGGGATNRGLLRGGVWTEAAPGEELSLGTLRTGFGMGKLGIPNNSDACTKFAQDQSSPKPSLGKAPDVTVVRSCWH